jgi:hypothetical protein
MRIDFAREGGLGYFPGLNKRKCCRSVYMVSSVGV